MKGKAIAKIVICSIVLLVSWSILMGGTAKAFGFNGLYFHMPNTSGYSVGPAAVDAVGVNKIKVNWVAGTVNIEAYDDEKIEITEEGATNPRYSLLWNVKNGELDVVFFKSQWFMFNMPLKTLTVKVPRVVAENLISLNIDSVSSNVNVSGVKSSYINLDVVSGNSKLNNVSTNNLNVDNVSGRVEVLGSVADVNIDTVSGSCDLTLDNLARKINIDGVSAGIRVFIPETLGFVASFESVSGDFNTNFLVTTSGDKHSYGAGELVISVDTVSGSLTVNKKAE